MAFCLASSNCCVSPFEPLPVAVWTSRLGIMVEPRENWHEMPTVRDTRADCPRALGLTGAAEGGVVRKGGGLAGAGRCNRQGSAARHKARLATDRPDGGEGGRRRARELARKPRSKTEPERY